MKLKENIISVLLPVHNAAQFLPECLESLKNQSYGDLQIIAIDDHSKDDSYAILRKARREINGLEVYRNKKTYGPAICYNRAMKKAKGRFIAFMNPNDISTVNRFKRQVNFLLKNQKTVAVGTQYTGIDEKSKKLDRSNLPADHEEIYHTLLSVASLKPETVMINRHLIPKDLLYFKSYKYPLVFTEVFVKFFQYGKVANIAHSLYLHREGIKRHGRNSSKMKLMQSTIKLWLTSRANHDYRPSIRTFFPQLVKGI